MTRKSFEATQFRVIFIDRGSFYLAQNLLCLVIFGEGARAAADRQFEHGRIIKQSVGRQFREVRPGDLVQIVECRPIAKSKTWRVIDADAAPA